MKTTPLSLSLIVMFAAACASSADRAQAQRAEDDRSPAQAADTQKPAASTTTYSERPLMIVGVYLESALASACGITLPPAAFFEFDSADLDVPGNSTLRDVATCLTTGPLAGRKVELVGHTDPRGDDEYNRQLGRSRADSVRDFLQSRGVTEDKLVTRSMGEQATAQDDPSAWPLDRRVDIRLLPE